MPCVTPEAGNTSISIAVGFEDCWPFVLLRAGRRLAEAIFGILYKVNANYLTATRMQFNLNYVSCIAPYSVKIQIQSINLFFLLLSYVRNSRSFDEENIYFFMSQIF